MDNVNSTLIIAEGYRQSLPPVLIRIFIYDSINRLDEFIREYRGCIADLLPALKSEAFGCKAID
jgi:hypothetical protein